MPQSNERKKELREERKKNGLCTTCGKNPPDDKGSMCAKCRSYYVKYRKDRVDQGGCRRCKDGTPEPGKKSCEACLEKQRYYVEDLRDQAFLAYGGYVCNCCGEKNPEFLQLDHLHNNGSEHRKEVGSKGGDRLYLWLKNNGYPSIMQVLCANCNYAKAHYGYCPHNPHTEVNDAPTRKTRHPRSLTTDS